MRIDIEPGSGFCFGVENAVNIAEELLMEGKRFTASEKLYIMISR